MAKKQISAIFTTHLFYFYTTLKNGIRGREISRKLDIPVSGVYEYFTYLINHKLLTAKKDNSNTNQYYFTKKGREVFNLCRGIQKEVDDESNITRFQTGSDKK